MTREDVKKVMSLIMAAYPNFNPEDMKATVDLWWRVFENTPVEQVAAAVTAYITTNTSGFAPSIGEIRRFLLPKTEQLEDMQAWSLVAQAIKNSSYESHEEYNKLPELVQKAVGSPGQLHQWAMTSSESVATVAQSNFLKCYRIAKKRAYESSMIPESVKKILAKSQIAIESK